MWIAHIIKGTLTRAERRRLLRISRLVHKIKGTPTKAEKIKGTATKLKKLELLHLLLNEI